MKNILLLLSLISILFSCSHGGNLTADTMVENAQKSVKTIAPKDVMQIMEGEDVFTLVDVRQKDEYYYGFIPGSVNIPRGSIEFNIAGEEFWENEGLYKPMSDETLILYCKKGKRSLLAAQTLMQMGYKKVMVIDGGWKNWEMSFPDFCDKNLEMLSGGSADHDDGGGC